MLRGYFPGVAAILDFTPSVRGSFQHRHRRKVLVLTGKGDEKERGIRPALFVCGRNSACYESATLWNSLQVRGPDARIRPPQSGTNQRVAARRRITPQTEITRSDINYWSRGEFRELRGTAVTYRAASKRYQRRLRPQTSRPLDPDNDSALKSGASWFYWSLRYRSSTLSSPFTGRQLRFLFGLESLKSLTCCNSSKARVVIALGLTS